MRDSGAARVFVIGGGVSDAGDLLLASARQTLADQPIGQQNRPAPVVRPAELGNSAGLVGAADLARIPRVVDHRKRMSERPSVKPVKNPVRLPMTKPRNIAWKV